jgi:hypothetical protein
MVAIQDQFHFIFVVFATHIGQQLKREHPTSPVER